MQTGFSKKDRALLQRLASGERIASSQMTQRMLSACASGWLPAGLVDCEASGLRRRVYKGRPARLDDLRRVIETTFPGYADPLPLQMTRAQAAQLQGNSKLAPLKDALVVVRDLCNVFGPDAASGDLRAFWVSTLESMEMPVRMKVLTVENEDTFQAVQSGANGLPEFDVAILTGGYLAGRTVRWLASIPRCVLVHYGDFDWEGMRIYQTIRSGMPEEAITLHRPPGLEQAFERQRALGKGAMTNAQRRPSAQCAEVAEVLDLIDRYGGVGVEQQVFEHP